MSDEDVMDGEHELGRRINREYAVKSIVRAIRDGGYVASRQAYAAIERAVLARIRADAEAERATEKEDLSVSERAQAICRCYFAAPDESDEERFLYEALESALGSERAVEEFIMREATR